VCDWLGLRHWGLLCKGHYKALDPSRAKWDLDERADNGLCSKFVGDVVVEHWAGKGRLWAGGCAPVDDYIYSDDGKHGRS
jgi:hypothetical protein